MFNRILVAIDGTPTSNRAFKVAVEFARDQQAKLDVVHVVEMLDAISFAPDGIVYASDKDYDDVTRTLRARGQGILDKAVNLAKATSVQATGRLIDASTQSVADEILRQARKLHSDAIVLGTHGRRGIRRLVMGSDAEAVLREARVPVMLVRAPRRRSATSKSARAAVPPKQTRALASKALPVVAPIA